MNGESAFGWVKAGGALLVAAVLAFVIWKLYGWLKSVSDFKIFSDVKTAWENEKVAYAKRKDEFAAGAARPPDAPYTVKENPAGAATGIVLPMRRRATGTSSDTAGAYIQPNNSPFLDENTNYL